MRQEQAEIEFAALDGCKFTEIRFTPAGFESPRFDPTFGGVFLFEQIEGHMPQHDTVLLTVILAHTTGILLKGDIKHPVEAIFDLPVAADRLSKGLGVARPAREVIAAFAGNLLSHLTLRFDHAHTAQSNPRLLRIEIGDHFRSGNRPVLALFHSAMSGLVR